MDNFKQSIMLRTLEGSEPISVATLEDFCDYTMSQPEEVSNTVSNTDSLLRSRLPESLTSEMFAFAQYVDELRERTGAQ